MKNITIFGMVVLCVAIIVTAGCSSTEKLSSSDQAVKDKISEIQTGLDPLLGNYQKAMQAHDLAGARSSSVAVQQYIDENLPVMTQVAQNATTKQNAGMDYALALTDVRYAMNKTITGADEYEKGNVNEGIALWNSGVEDFANATSLIKKVKSEL
jgi:hypothetical protein